MAEAWDAEWFARALIPLLNEDGARCFALSALMEQRTTLYRALMYLHGPLAPIRPRDLLDAAAVNGYYEAVEELQRRSRHVRSGSRAWVADVVDGIHSIRAVMAAARVVPSDALLRVMRLQGHRPARFHEDAMYAACRRGDFAGVIWWHHVVEYSPIVSLEASASNGHGAIVRWLLDHAGQVRRHSIPIDLACGIRYDDDRLGDLGIISWRDAVSKTSYAFVESVGYLQPTKEFRTEGYQLMDWAAGQGDFDLLVRLAAHPVARDTISANAIVLAVQNHHRHVVEWLLEHKYEQVEVTLAQAMATAAEYGDLEMLQLIHSNPLGVTGSLNGVFLVAATNGHLEVLQWLFAECLDPRIPPKYLVEAGARSGSLQVVQYLHQEQGYPLNLRVLNASISGSSRLDQAIAEYMLSHLPTLSHSERLSVLEHTAREATLPMIQWCLTRLDLDQTGFRDAVRHWCLSTIDSSSSSTEPRADLASVLHQVYAWNPEAFIQDASRIRLAVLVGKEHQQVLEWILRVCPEPAEYVSIGADAKWLQRLDRPYAHPSTLERIATRRHGTRLFTSTSTITSPAVIDSLVLIHRPQLSRLLAEFPVWAVRRGDVVWLEHLEDIQHPRLFDERVFRTLLRYSRDATVMMWFLGRRPSVWIQGGPRVVKWAAKYTAIGVLTWVLDNLESMPRSSGGYIVYESIAAWNAASCGHVDVLDFLLRRSPGQLVRPHFMLRLVERAAQRGHVSVLQWVASKIHTVPVSELALCAANCGTVHGHAQVVRWAMAIGGEGNMSSSISRRSLGRAGGRGDVVF